MTRDPETTIELVTASEHMIVKHESGPFTSSRMTFVAGLIAALTTPLVPRSGLPLPSRDVEMQEIIVELPSGVAFVLRILSDDERTRLFVGALERALTMIDDSKLIDPFAIDTDGSSMYTISTRRQE